VANIDRKAMIGPTIVGSIRRFRRIVVFTTVVALVCGLFWVLISPSKYAGKAGIVIAPLPASLSTGSGTTHVTPATYNGQQIALIESPTVASGAAHIVNALFPNARLTGPQVQAATTVKAPVPGTATSNGAATQVIVTLGSPTFAAAAANAVIKSYLAQTKAVVREQAGNSIAALQSAIARTTSQIDGLAVPSGTSGTSGGRQPTTISPRRINTTTTRPPHATTTRPPHATTTRPPRTTTTRAPATTTTAPTTTSAAAELRSKDGDQVQLASFDTAGGGATFRLTATTASTTTTSPATTTTTSPATTTTTSTTSSSGTNANIVSQRAALQTTLANLNRSKAQIQVNKAVDLAFEPTTVRATIPTRASNGNWFRTILIFSAVGFLVGILTAFVLASSRRRFENATDPESLYGAALITTVPAFELPAWSRVALPVLTDPTDEAAEAYRILATVLRARRGDSDCLVAAFSAADLGAGTTTTVANCGLALAEMGERVLVIDGDPLGRGLTQALVENASPDGLGLAPMGLSELLEGFTLAETTVPAVGNPDLMVVPSGRNTDMAVHRWRTATLRGALEQMSDHFDVVLIDTPPMGTSSFSMDLSSIAEHLVLVVPHYDFVDLHESIARRLPIIGIELLGYVYNGALSNIRFAPYFPILRGSSAAALGPGLAAHRPPPPTAAVGGAIPGSPGHERPSEGYAPASTSPAHVNPDDTGMVRRVVRDGVVVTQTDAPTGQVPIVSGGEGETGVVPRVTEDDRVPTWGPPRR
jgi:Mrp family chromosome partitioning ATPase